MFKEESKKSFLYILKCFDLFVGNVYWCGLARALDILTIVVANRLDFFVEAGRVIDYVCGPGAGVGANPSPDQQGLELQDLMQLLTNAEKSDGGVKACWNKLAVLSCLFVCHLT